ncbi:hypothetical protein [Flavobacterium sp. N1736]|uniref:hypothetical protein n=1 Tax=Flavobacterium sp. N1736 TaxID=2986823 RepID=UPI00222578B6|nr:hypothetical protein [Flavobacterium sp. N1736]
MKKVLLLIIILYNLTIHSQTFNGYLDSQSLSWSMDQKDFNSLPRVGIAPMSIKLWDNYNGLNAPSQFGSLLEINGRTNHLVSQLYFDNTWVGGRIQYRSAFYSQDTWESWRYLLDSKSDVESIGNLKIAGAGNSFILNGNLGIGTNNPNSKLEIIGSSQIGYEIGTLKLKSSTLNQFMYFGYDDQFSAGYIQSVKPGTDQQNILIAPVGGNVGIGTKSPDAKLAVNGTIHSKEVKVDLLGWSDFVFKKEYNLPTLQEVEKHINEKGHLENIPSEKEVLENGINLGEMNAKLLQKIEELTLYSIQQNKKIAEQTKEIESLKDLVLRVAKIEKELSQK